MICEYCEKQKKHIKEWNTIKICYGCFLNLSNTINFTNRELNLIEVALDNLKDFGHYLEASRKDKDLIINIRKKIYKAYNFDEKKIEELIKMDN